MDLDLDVVLDVDVDSDRDVLALGTLAAYRGGKLSAIPAASGKKRTAD